MKKQLLFVLFSLLLSSIIYAQNASFQISPTCDGAVVNITGESGGTFTFNPTPTDGAVIDATTGTVTNAISGGTYTIEYTTSGTQPLTSSETFTVLLTPNTNQPSDYEICDNDGDGFAEFDLTVMDQQILGGQDPNNFIVLYYLTQADADAQVNPLSSPFTNYTNPQTIYAVVNSTSGNCVSNVVTYNLIVNSLNINLLAFDMETCGYGNGVGVFDLTIFESQVTNGNSSLLVSYFESSNDAVANTNPITNPTYYENFNSPYYQTITIRIEDPNSGCVNVSSELYLYVNELQVVQPTPLIAADPDNDGFTPFDLHLKDNEITGGVPNFIVTYHETQVDADNNTNALSSPYTNIVQNYQTVYARVESTYDNCSATVPLQLLTEYVPFQINETSLDACGGSATGVVMFDLTTANPDILSSVIASDYTVAYYENYDDAILQTNAITNPSTYSYSPNIPIIYAGVTETSTGEYVFTTIALNVNPLPTINFNGDYSICDGTSIVLNPNTNDANYVFQWSTGETSQEIVVTTAGTYTVTITNPLTGCTNSDSVNVGVGTVFAIGTPQDLIACDGNAVFDLTTTLPEIINGEDPNTLTIGFYESQQDAFNNVNEIQNPTAYTSLSGFQTIYVSGYFNGSQIICPATTSFNLVTENCPVLVDCAQPITSSFCYANNNTQQFTYTSISGTPLQLVIISGQVENNYDELIVLDSDGVTNLNATPYGNSGDVSNLTFIASGDTITIYVDSDLSINCQDNGYTSIDYVVTCFDTAAVPNCNASLIEPQDLAVDVNENTDLTWSPATGLVTGYYLTVTLADGTVVLNNLDVGNVNTYNVGTLNYNTQYFVTITPYNANGNATTCITESFTTRADPNVIVDCAQGNAVNTTFCYINNETQQYNFSSSDGSTLYIVFNSGSTENNFDELIVLDSDGVTNLNADNPYGLNDDGDLTGLTFTTTGTTATIYIQSDGSVIGCENDVIDFDVFCSANIGFIEVNAFLDDNNDGVFNGTDTPFTNGFFTYEVNNDGSINTVESNTGSFTIVNQVETNTYDITFATNTGYENCFTISTALFENVSVANGSTITVDFPITQQMPCEDLAVYLIPFSAPRPGFNYWNDLVIENLGSTTIASGTVTFIHDPLVNYVDATAFSSQVSVTPNATGATVDFTNLLPGESRVIWFRLYTPPTVNLGEFVTSSATYSTASNDVVPENNISVISQEVIGSYDPNDITESHGREIIYNSFITTDEYLYYTIRFQNIGTAEAINVRIENTVDPLLDISTLQMLNSKHDYVLTQNGNQLTWVFDNINLPAQSQDDFGSNGYVYFKIKPSAGYAIGTVIPNSAEIYFDFNAPVITNTFETEFIAQPLSVDEFNTNGFTLYPNPSNNIVNIKLNNITKEDAFVEVIDVQGKIVIKNTVTESLQLNVKNLEAGVYFVKVNQNNNQIIKKLIVE
ncbi:putative secreted protein (Por secretion system target) [Lacinutrix venerupis]|uniref:T9SS type A sorting domain-containing protein n=1 Tax=Lacinutrix venerupis TaxID=1486034 RepID=UPI000EAC5F74|nr:T9SS type A sorting domain-containing protein [Lacinutrix venerupis]RLJ64461.1 putative secreted protein (Por secretion system target) [Lacinutrix venerupis]